MNKKSKKMQKALDKIDLALKGLSFIETLWVLEIKKRFMLKEFDKDFEEQLAKEKTKCKKKKNKK